jgi:peptidoglycan/xylan/chitin deacetylase (PgdA/CDA1 family)
MTTHRVHKRRLAPRLIVSKGPAWLLAVALAWPLAFTPPPALACNGTIYLTFDTGSMSQADLIARTLQRHQAKATFFLANEKTVHGDDSLDPGWANWWRARVAEGHAFGSHTFDHLVLQHDAPGGRIVVKPGFGAHKGQSVVLSAGQYCQQLRTVDQRFAEMTGSQLDPIWRAPAGRTSPNALAAARGCGYAHVGWSEAGFSGDELPSETHPNASLLAKSLRELKDGDIFMAHLGIWSRKDAWAPANLPTLLARLQQKGFCFATLREHPQYRDWLAAQKPAPHH